MSVNNPNVREILENSVSKNPHMRKHLHKSYLNLAKSAFYFKYKRKATIENSQELYDHFESEWTDYYIERPKREKEEHELFKSLLPIIKRKRIDLSFAGIIYLRDKVQIDFKLNKFQQTLHFIKSINKLEEFKEYLKDPTIKHPLYSNRGYSDYSHLAYNGVTDDF